MKQGFLQALGVSIYIAIVGIFMWNANSWIGPLNNFFGPIFVLTLFATSALICGLLVFYKPYKLFFAGKKKQAVRTVIFTAVWLFTLLLLFLSYLLIFK